MKSETRNIELKTSRLEALNDGIFAIAMTILIFSFEAIWQAPQLHTNESFLMTLGALWRDLVYYVESFIILGLFWLGHHHQFSFIRKSDSRLAVFNILALMFIALLPFSTVIAGDYGQLRAAALLFEVNLFLAGLIFYLQWAYATGNKRLVDADLSSDIISKYKKKNLVIPVVSLIAIAVSLFYPVAGTSLFFLAPFVTLFIKR